MIDPAMRELVNDLVAEQTVLDEVVAGLTAAQWEVPSPADGWLLRDCVAHLAEIDATAAYVMANQRMPPPVEGRDGVLSARQVQARSMSAAELLEWWREARRQLTGIALLTSPKERLPWAGPPMSARSFITARLMEAWSHGLDIHDAAGATPVDTDRLRHVAHLGYVTREFAYRNRGLNVPTAPLYVKLTAPSSAIWTWGPEDAEDRIVGPAGAFCRVVTQRLHANDADLDVTGPHAAEFLGVAQAFAGPPGAGRPPKGK